MEKVDFWYKIEQLKYTQKYFEEELKQIQYSIALQWLIIIEIILYLVFIFVKQKY
jgi:hypothetical protein